MPWHPVAPCWVGLDDRAKQGSASLRLAIEQAPWWTHAGRIENPIVDNLDVLDRMADLSSPAAAEAAGLQKTNSLSVKVWNPRGLEKDDRPPPPQLSIASQSLG